RPQPIHGSASSPVDRASGRSPETTKRPKEPPGPLTRLPPMQAPAVSLSWSPGPLRADRTVRAAAARRKGLIHEIRGHSDGLRCLVHSRSPTTGDWRLTRSRAPPPRRESGDRRLAWRQGRTVIVPACCGRLELAGERRRDPTPDPDVPAAV